MKSILTAIIIISLLMASCSSREVEKSAKEIGSLVGGTVKAFIKGVEESK